MLEISGYCLTRSGCKIYRLIRYLTDLSLSSMAFSSSGEKTCARCPKTCLMGLLAFSSCGWISTSMLETLTKSPRKQWAAVKMNLSLIIVPTYKGFLVPATTRAAIHGISLLWTSSSCLLESPLKSVNLWRPHSKLVIRIY